MERFLFLWRALDHAGGLAIAQELERAVDQVERRLGLLGVAVVALRLLVEVVDAFFEAVEVGKHQLGLDRVDVGDRIDLARDVGHIVVNEAAHHMRNRIDLAHMRRELVAEAFAAGGAANQASNVDEGEPRRLDLDRLCELGERVEPRVRDQHFAHQRLHGAERIIRRLRGRGRGQRVEDGRLAHVGQPKNAALEAHCTSAPFPKFVIQLSTL